MAKNKLTQNGGGTRPPIAADKQGQNSGIPLGRPFPPGVSGNPNGRPPGPSITTLHKELLMAICPKDVWEPIEEKLPGSFPKHWQPPTWGQYHVVRNNLKAADLEDGDIMAKIVWEMVDGKPKQQISGPDGGPIQIKHFNLKSLTEDQVRELREHQQRIDELLMNAAANAADQKSGSK